MTSASASNGKRRRFRIRKKGLIHIATERRIDWNPIQAEYIGGASYGVLAKRYGLAKSTIFKKSVKEHWDERKKRVANATETRVIERIADAAADNATLAEDIKRGLLLRLKRIADKYPMDATEVRTKVGSSQAIYRIRDLTAAYKDLTGDMPQAAPANDLLQSLMDLEREARAHD